MTTAQLERLEAAEAEVASLRRQVQVLIAVDRERRASEQEPTDG